MSTSFYNLSKENSLIIKAVAIIAIVLHNYLHQLTGIGFNEFWFNRDAIFNFFDSVVANPSAIFSDFFTFFGHYGVALFLFVSAYGLTKQRIQVKMKSYLSYLSHRLIKIYALLIFGLIIFFCYYYRSLSLETCIKATLHYLFCPFDFRESTLLSYVGPWWFFRPIIQFYIIFPLLFFIINRYKVKVVVILILLSQIGVYLLLPLRVTANFSILGSIFGHLPEVVLGISLALLPTLKLDYRVIIVAGVLFVLSCFFEFLFPVSFLSILILMLVSIRGLFNISKSNIGIKSLLFIGRISMFMFLINAIIRQDTWKLIAKFTEGTSFQLFLMALIHTVLVIILSYILYRIYNYCGALIKKYTKVSIL